MSKIGEEGDTNNRWTGVQQPLVAGVMPVWRQIVYKVLGCDESPNSLGVRTRIWVNKSNEVNGKKAVIEIKHLVFVHSVRHQR